MSVLHNRAKQIKREEQLGIRCVGEKKTWLHNQAQHTNLLIKRQCQIFVDKNITYSVSHWKMFFFPLKAI